MDEDVRENNEEEQSKPKQNFRFSKGYTEEKLEEEIKYELDFEEELEDDEENQYESWGKEEFRDEEEDKIKSKTGAEINAQSTENTELKSSRKSIYDLDSYIPTTSLGTDYSKSGESEEVIASPEKNIHYSQSVDASGVARLDLSPLTQKIIGCVVGENVTTEYPWIYVNKEIIEDNIDLHDESSDFLPIKEEIENFPDTKILIGYAPSSSESGQFYICLTEAGRDAIIRQIEIQRLDQENYVRNAMFKEGNKWQDLGSGPEVDDHILKNTRALIHTQVEFPHDAKKNRVHLVNREVDDQRDGYVKIVPYRETFENIPKALINSSNQLCLYSKESDSQTVIKSQINGWSQYLYEYTPVDISKISETQIEQIKKCLKQFDDDLYSQVLLNAAWDIYTDDYAKLSHSKEKSRPPMTIVYREHQNYYDGKICMNKVVNDLSWHPFWTGIAACAYVDYAKDSKLTGPNSNNKVLKSTERKLQTLVWSFTDCLKPRLILNAPIEISAVSFCPSNEDLIVGGCSNGQVAIWHIPGKIEEMEAVKVQTADQVKYAIAMKNKMTWMRDPMGSWIIEPAAMSSLQYSQKGRITQIEWIPMYNKVGKNGRISSLPDDTNPKDLSCQFITSSEDGTIAFWDLKLQQSKGKTPQKNVNKEKSSNVQKPEVLMQLISPYEELNGVLQPDYMLIVRYPESQRRAVITTINIFNPKMPKEQVAPFPKKGSKVTVRRYYKNIYKKPEYEMQPRIFIGTVEGDCGIITWDGYDFLTGILGNRETCKWLWLNIIHDGPVTHAVRSKFLPDLIMTVGGKIFAVWQENFKRTFFWNKSNFRYTACSWGNFRPSVLTLARSDGTIEIWNLIINTSEPSIQQSLSGKIITGIFSHQLYLNPQCVAFCDFNGALRVFLAPPDLLDFNDTEIEWMRNFTNRTIKGMQRFEAWQESWSDTNMESVERKQKMTGLENEKKAEEIEENVRAEIQEAANKIKSSAKIQMNKDFMEVARSRWISMELNRMQRIILEKKGLKQKDLEKRRAPVIKMEREAKAKKQKLQKIIQLQDKIFEDTAAFLIPTEYYEQQKSKIPPLSDTQNKLENTKNEVKHSDEMQFSTPEEEIIYNFMEVEAEALSTIRQRSQKYAFQWRSTLAEGRARRECMDVELQEFKKCTKKNRDKENTIHLMHSFQSILYHADYSESYQDADDVTLDGFESETQTEVV